jgi:Amt family ammonium transporter
MKFQKLAARLMAVAVVLPMVFAGAAAVAQTPTATPAPAPAPAAASPATPAPAAATPAPAAATPAPAAAAPAAATPAPAGPAKPPAYDHGDTAWMLTSTALVLMMTIPGLALFYAGMVRRKNILATVMQSFAICCLVTIVWTVCGYSLAFTNGPTTGSFMGFSLNSLIGDGSRFMLHGIADNFSKQDDTGFILGNNVPGVTAAPYTVPETVYMMFQMTFAIITPALIAGAFAERMKFSAMCIFMVGWSIFSYSLIAHWVWAPTGWLSGMGTLDYAGGTVVHINAGIAGLMCCLVMGKRRGYGHDNMAPHNLTYAVIGASLLWVGWFGFNAGSAVGATGRAGMAMAVTQIATAAAALAWMFTEWVLKGKPSVLGIISGAVAGLVAITPASGFVLPFGAIVIGVAAGVICFLAAAYMKHMLGYDDSLDTFGVHGIGGIVGALLTGVYASATIGGTDGSLAQFIIQCKAVSVTLIWSSLVSLVLLFGLKYTIGLTVDAEQEQEGLDLALHGESAA